MSPVHLGVGLAIVLLAVSFWRLHWAYRQAVLDADHARERYQALFAGGFEGLLVHDAGEIIDANGLAEQMFGYTNAELRQMPLEQLVSEEWRAQARERIRTRSEAGEDWIARRKDGSVFPLQVLARDHSYQGRPTRVLALRDLTTKRQADLALHEQEERFRRLFEDTPIGLYRIGIDGRILMANRAFARIFGLPQNADLTGIDLRAIASGSDDGGDLLRSSLACRADGEATEHAWVRAGGSRAIVSLHSRAVLGSDGLLTYCEGSVEDVTERRLAEEALRAGDERLRTIVSAASDAIIIADGSGIIIFWNRAAEAMFGYNAEEAIGRHVGMIMPDRYRTAGMAGIARVAASDTPEVHARTVELAGLRKDGSEFPCELSISVGRSGAALFLTASVRDISERVRANEALRQSEDRYRRLFDCGSDAVFLNGFSADGMPGKFTEVNDVACERLGYTRAELLTMSAADINAPESVAELPAITQQLHRGKRVLWETVHVAKDGGRIPVEISAQLFELGGTTMALLAARDISERKRLEQRLLQAQKMETVGRLAGGIAHDFNNLLTAISGHASFALDDLPTGVQAREDLTEILSAAERAAALTQQLLAFSRRQVMRPKIVNLNDLVLDMEGMLRRLVGDDNTLVTITAPDLGLVRVDPSQVHQVIANLVLNARDALPNGGRVVIETANASFDDTYTAAHLGTVAGEHVMLSVSDTGIGMSPEVQERVFEPFFTTKGLGKGTGLGLASVYGIVKQHQGNIWVYSEPGQGTSIKVYLPRELSRDRPLQRIEATVLPTGDETVLVVEDEAVVRGIMVRVLRQLGYKVIEAANGEQALGLVQRAGDIDLLVTDMVMPEMGGMELARRVREAMPDTKVLFVSGYTDATTARCGSLNENSDFLAKPFSARSLAGKVRSLLDR
ncbi:MAG: hybrid sensor histidine kinase/response regulator [Anaerolineae bacterium]